MVRGPGAEGMVSVVAVQYVGRPCAPFPLCYETAVTRTIIHCDFTTLRDVSLFHTGTWDLGSYTATSTCCCSYCTIVSTITLVYEKLPMPRTHLGQGRA